ncbi:MAG: response regulator [Nannocystaceae bacterium]|nr:response regulator [bacterium]
MDESDAIGRVGARLRQLLDHGVELTEDDLCGEPDLRARAALRLLNQLARERRGENPREADELAVERARVEAERADHRRAQEELSVLLRHFPGAVWTTDDDLRVVSAAGECAELLGLSEASVGEPLTRHVPAGGLAIGALHAVADLGRGNYEFRHAGRTFQVTVSPLEEHQRASLIWVAADVTERRQVDAEMIRARLERGQKLEQIGLLAGGIALDFNNLLTSIIGNASLARTAMRAGESADEYIDRLEQQADVAADLSRQLLAYSGQGRVVVQPVNLSDTVQQMATLLQSSVSKGASFDFRLASGLPAVRADSAQIRQLIMNLITNASDALGGKDGVIVLSTSVVEVDEGFLRGLEGAEDAPGGRYVCLEVRDPGHGMDAETMERMFDPFFSTKPDGHGLGLAATLGILRGHRGKVRVSSTPGEGTSVRIFLPVSARKAEQSGRYLAPVYEPPPGGGVVLVVDDEEGVRRMVTAALTEADHEVVAAANGVEALKRLAERPDIDVVLLDVMMPQMDGAQALRLLRDRAPNIRVILTSGYGERSVLDWLRVSDKVDFLKKPYRVEDVVTKVGEVLERGRERD